MATCRSRRCREQFRLVASSTIHHPPSTSHRKAYCASASFQSSNAFKMSQPAAKVKLQSGVIPYRRGANGSIEILLVTSGTRKRWIIPKGNLEPDLDKRESARLEAYEEAGVMGMIRPEPLGSYLHDRGDRAPASVEVYLMEVERVLPDDKWQEHGYRERRWMPIADARDAVLEDGLKELFTDVAKLLS